MGQQSAAPTKEQIDIIYNARMQYPEVFKRTFAYAKDHTLSFEQFIKNLKFAVNMEPVIVEVQKKTGAPLNACRQMVKEQTKGNNDVCLQNITQILADNEDSILRLDTIPELLEKRQKK